VSYVETAKGDAPNFERLFADRPDVYAAWGALKDAIAGSMDTRRYELATLAAALQLRSSYCSLAHGKVLAERFLDPGTVQTLATDRRAAGLEEVDVAVMDLAAKVAADAGSVTQADVDRLRGLGLSDDDVFGVVLTAAARSFFTKAVDAMGVLPDPSFGGLDAGMRDALTVGRPIEAAS
jgi:uncharacterized peroxidase-related enzyme